MKSNNPSETINTGGVLFNAFNRNKKRDPGGKRRVRLKSKGRQAERQTLPNKPTTTFLSRSKGVMNKIESYA